MNPVRIFLFLFTSSCVLHAQSNDAYADRKEVYGNFEYETDVNAYVFDLNTLAIFQNGYKLTTEEFRYTFKPSKGDSGNPAKQTFLQNLVVMHQEAFLGMKMGFDTSASFKGELEKYRRSLIKPYLEQGYSREVALRLPQVKWELMEYYNGIVLFELMDREVWSKAVKDTAGARKFYDDHLVRYAGKSFSAAHGQVVSDYQHELELILNESAIKNCMVRINQTAAERL